MKDSSDKSKLSYQDMHNRLDEILSQMQSPQTSIDDAIKLHKEGTELVSKLEAYIAEAELVINKIKS